MTDLDALEGDKPMSDYNPWGFWYPKCLRTPAKPKAKMSHLDRAERNLKIVAALLVFEFVMLAFLVVHEIFWR